MKAITLRNIPPNLARVLRRRADAEGSSLNKTVLHILEESAGTRQPKPRRTMHHDLDALAGAWTRRQSAAFDKVLSGQRRIDPELWE
jgi:plasmid stability protein